MIDKLCPMCQKNMGFLNVVNDYDCVMIHGKDDESQLAIYL